MSSVPYLFPHSYRPLTTRGIYSRLSVALVPIVIAGIIRFGPAFLYRAGPVILVSVLLDYFLARGLRRGNTVFDTLYTVMLLLVLLPPLLPWHILILSSAVTIVVGKWTFGGTGSYWMHPAIIGFLFASVAFPWEMAHSFTTPFLWPDAAVDGAITEFLNVVLFSPLGFAVTDGLFNFLFGNQMGIVGASAILLIIVSSVYLLANDIIPPVLPVFFTVTMFAGLMVTGEKELIHSLLDAQVLLVAFFLYPDPSSRPKTKTGTVLVPVFTGLLTIVFIQAGFSCAPLYAYAVGNIVTPLIDSIAGRAYVRGFHG